MDWRKDAFLKYVFFHPLKCFETRRLFRFFVLRRFSTHLSSLSLNLFVCTEICFFFCFNKIVISHGQIELLFSNWSLRLFLIEFLVQCLSCTVPTIKDSMLKRRYSYNPDKNRTFALNITFYLLDFDGFSRFISCGKVLRIYP